MKMINTILMIREDMFYPVDVPASVLESRTLRQVAKDFADCNPGTVRVEDIKGQTLWPLH